MNSHCLKACTSLVLIYSLHDLCKKYISTLNVNRQEQSNNTSPTESSSTSSASLSSARISSLNLLLSTFLQSNVSDNTPVEHQSQNSLEAEIPNIPEVSYNIIENILHNRLRSIPIRFIQQIIESFVISIDFKLDSNKPSCMDIPNNIEENDIPDEFKCPISKSIMKDPVIAADGFTYDRSFMETHLRNSNRSPLNNENLLFPYLIPNWNIRKLIQAYILKIQEETTKAAEGSIDQLNSRIELPISILKSSETNEQNVIYSEYKKLINNSVRKIIKITQTC